MRFIFWALLCLSACDDKTPSEQCLAGAQSVDGTPCCFAIMGQACTGDPLSCIQDESAHCSCENHVVFCSDLPIPRDLSITSTD